MRQSLRADAGRGDLLKTITDRVGLPPNGLRMILSLVPLTPAAAPADAQASVFSRELPLRIKRRGVEIRFAVDASDLTPEARLIPQWTVMNLEVLGQFKYINIRVHPTD